MASTSVQSTASPGFFGKTKIILEMIKFEHTIFALPFAYVGLFLAARHLGQFWPTFAQFFWVTLAMVGARSFAMAINRLIDRNIDARNPRTATRALPKGILTPDSVRIFALVSAAIFFTATWMLAPLARLVWPVVIGPFILYSYTKRFTWMNHVVLGVCLGLAPIGAWIGVTNSLSLPVVLLGIGVALWTAGFDIIYACQDIDVDRRDGLFSVPARFGIEKALLTTKLMHIATVILFAMAGAMMGLGVTYYLGVLGVAILLTYENSLVSPTDLSRLDAAFFTMNSFVSIIVFVFTGIDLLLMRSGVA